MNTFSERVREAYKVNVDILNLTAKKADGSRLTSDELRRDWSYGTLGPNEIGLPELIGAIGAIARHPVNIIYSGYRWFIRGED